MEPFVHFTEHTHKWMPWPETTMQIVHNRMTRDPDRSLLLDVANGDRRAFRRLHKLFYARLFSFALRTGLSPDLADEAASDTMLAVWKSASQFEGRSKVSTWMFGIAYRQAMRRHRRGLLDQASVSLDEAAPVSAHNVAVLNIDDHLDLATAMTALSPEARALVEMTYIWGFSMQEAADAIGVPVGTVKSRMSRARAALQLSLKVQNVEQK